MLVPFIIPGIGKDSKGKQKASVFILLLYAKSLDSYAFMYLSRAIKHSASVGYTSAVYFTEGALGNDISISSKNIFTCLSCMFYEVRSLTILRNLSIHFLFVLTFYLF